MDQERKRQAARDLAAARPRQQFVCEVCGKEIEGYATGNHRKRFCSSTCRSQAYYPIRKAKREAAKADDLLAASTEEARHAE